MHTTRKLLRGVLAALVVALTGSAARGDNSWTAGGGDDTKVSNPANWSSGTVPTVEMVFTDDAAGKTVTFDADYAYAISGYLWIGSTTANKFYTPATETAEEVFNPVVWEATETTNGISQTGNGSHFRIADASKQNGALEIHGGTYTTTTELRIGYGGNAKVVMEDGVLTSGGQLHLAQGNATGRYIQNGGQLTVKDWLCVGSTSSSSDTYDALFQVNGGSVTNSGSNITIGSDGAADAKAVLEVNNGEVYTTGEIYVNERRYADCELRVNGGKVHANGALYANLKEQSQNGKITVTDGELTSGGAMVLNNSGNGSAQMLVTGGYVEAVNKDLQVGYKGDADLTVSGGVVRCGFWLTTARGAMGDAVIRVYDGELTAAYRDGVFQNSTTGNGVLDLCTTEGSTARFEQYGGVANFAGSANRGDNGIAVKMGTGTKTKSELYLAGGTFNAVGQLCIGFATGSTNTVTIAKDALVCVNTISTKNATDDDTANNNLIFDGGTLQPRENSTSFISGKLTGTVQAGGGIIDLNGHNVTIGAALNGTGTLLVTNSSATAATLTFSSTPACPVKIAGDNVKISGKLSTFVIGEGQSYVYGNPSAAVYEVYGTIDNTSVDLDMNGATINVREGGKVLSGVSGTHRWIRLQSGTNIINLYEGGEVQMTHLQVNGGTGHQFNFKGGTLTQLGWDDGYNKYLFNDSDDLTITADEHGSVVDTQGYTAIIAKAVVDADYEAENGFLVLKGNGLNTITMSTATALAGASLTTLKIEDIIAKLPVGIVAPLTFGDHGYASFDCSAITDHTQTVRLSTGLITVPEASADYEHVLVSNDGSAGWEVTTDSETEGLIIKPLGETLPETDVWVGDYVTWYTPRSNAWNPCVSEVRNWTAGFPTSNSIVIVPQGGDAHRLYYNSAFNCDTLKLPAVGEVRFFNQQDADLQLRARVITGNATLAIGGMALQARDDYPLNVQVPVVVRQYDHFSNRSSSWYEYDVYFKGTSADKPLTFEKSFTVPSGVTARFDNDYVLVKGDVTVDGSLEIGWSKGDETISRTLTGSGTIKGSVTMASGATLATKGLKVTNKLTLNDNAVVIDDETAALKYFKVASAATVNGTAHLATAIEGMTIKVMNNDVIFCDEDYGSEIDPVVPGTELIYNTHDEAVAAATSINGDKDKYIKLPEGVDTKYGDTYRSYLTAVASGIQVKFEFSPEGEAAVQDEVDESVKELDITGDDSTITTTPGLWYAILGGTKVGAIATPGTEVMATEVATKLEKPNLCTTDAAFYRVRVSPTESKK